MLEDEPNDPLSSGRDMTIPDVGRGETRRAPSTVRTWLASGALEGYKLNGRDWRIPRGALRAYLDRQAPTRRRARVLEGAGDLGAWRRAATNDDGGDGLATG
jgi:excisionase family DNA binding protein